MGAVLTLNIPIAAAASTSAARRAQYISPSTAAVTITLANPPTGYVQPGTIALTPGGTNATSHVACPASGNDYACAIPLSLPPGTDTLTIAAKDSSGNLLSQQSQAFSIATGQANALTLTLDAQVSSTVATGITVTTAANSSAYVGPAAGTALTSTTNVAIISPQSGGSNAQTFQVVVKDKDGNKIYGPGLPAMTVTSSSSEITVSTIVQQSNDGTTPYSFQLSAPASGANVNSTTPSTITVKFSGAAAPADGITAVQSTFTAANAKLIAVGSQGTALATYVYGDGELMTYGPSLGAGPLLGHEADLAAFDSANNLYIADDTSNNSAVLTVPFAALRTVLSASPITAPTGNAVRLEPYQINTMDVSGNGTVVVSQNAYNTTVNGLNSQSYLPDTVIVASAGSSTFTLGWNNIATASDYNSDFTSGCACLAASVSAYALTDTAHSTAFGYGSINTSSLSSDGPGYDDDDDTGYVAFIYPPGSSAGSAAVSCDVPTGTATCRETDASGGNIDVANDTFGTWDFVDQKFVIENNDMNSRSFELLDFAATGGSVSTTSSVLDTLTPTGGTGPYQMASSAHGLVAVPWSYGTTTTFVNIYNNATGTKVLSDYRDPSDPFTTVGNDGAAGGVAFISDANNDALLVVGTTGAGNYLRVYTLNTGAHTATRIASSTVPFAPSVVASSSRSQTMKLRRRRGASIGS